MQVETYRKEDVQNLIQEAKHIAVIPSKIAGADAFAAGVAIYRMLDHKGKDVELIYSGKFPEEVSEIIQREEVMDNLSERELLVTVDYSGTSAEKVHYKTEDDKLTFKLGPIPKDFDLSKVKSQITGFDFDLFIVIGTQALQNLGHVYESLKEDLKQEKIINIDNTKRNSRFGVVNVIDADVESLSLLVFQKASEWKLTPEYESAKALLKGITYREDKKAVNQA